MKTKILLFILAICVLESCQKEAKLEMKKIKTTETETQWEIHLEHSVFSFTEAAVEKSCAIFNDEIGGLVNGIHAAFIEQCKEQIASLDSVGIKTSGKYELFISDTVYMASDKFISVLVEAYEYFGGANGNTNYYALNYDIKNNKFITNNDLLDHNKSREINALLKTYLKDPEHCYTFEKPRLDISSAINFSPNSLEVTYGKYILGPGACGPITISVPLEKLHGMVKIAFR